MIAPSANDESSIIGDLAAWAIDCRSSELSADLLHHARRATVDWLGASIAGGQEPSTQALIKGSGVAAGGCGGRALVVPLGTSAPALTAALINGGSAHASEADDIDRDGIFHPGAPTISAALAVGQERNVDGRALLTAIVIGYEIAMRIARALQPAHYRLWNATGTIGTIGAAAAAATIVCNDRDQLADALANAVALAAGVRKSYAGASMAKMLNAGHAAMSGVLTASTAEFGLRGARTILEGEEGFGAVVSDAPRWDLALEELGEPTMIRNVTFKAYPCCGHAIASVDAALVLRDKLAAAQVGTNDVAEIAVSTYSKALEVAGSTDTATVLGAKFSVPFLVATALRDGSLTSGSFDEANRRDEGLDVLAARVSLDVSPRIDAAFPSSRGAELTARLVDGRSMTTGIVTRRGDPGKPLTDEELTAKFIDLAQAVLGPERAQQAVEIAWSIDPSAPIPELGQIVAPPSRL